MSSAAPPPPPPPPPPPSGEGPRSHALHHVTEATRTYPCRQCGGELEFAIDIQRLRCPFCGNVQELVEAGDATVDEQDFRAALAALHDGGSDRAAVSSEGDKEIVCQNCGGHTVFTGSLTASNCPYCATPIQRDDIHQAPARLRVDGVVPFQVDEPTAKAAIDEWIHSRWFAPSEFKKYNRTGAFNSVYSAYFTYDADTQSSYRGQRGTNYTVTVGSGDNRRTETRIRWSHVSGVVADRFDDVAVLANDGLDRNHVQALEPWPTGEARAYSAEYVAGHLCRTYDHDVEECFAEAQGRMDEAIRETVRRDIGGDHQRISDVRTQWGTMTYKHLLLPIWLLTVIYDQRPFQVMINGVTGEVHGQRPYSRVKIAAAVVAALVVVAVLVFLYARYRG